MNSDMLHEKQPSPSGESSEVHASDREIQDNEGGITLPVVDPLFTEEDIPSEVALAISQHLNEEESIFVIFRLSSTYSFTNEEGKTEKAPFWTVITGTRLFLLAISATGQTYFDMYDQQTVFKYQNGFVGRDAIKIADKSLSTGAWEGEKRQLFKEAVNLFPLPEYEKYLYIADMYMKKEQVLQAVPFLQKSIALVPTIKSYLTLINIFFQHNKQEEAFGAIQEALTFTEPASLIQESQILFPDNVEILLYLAAGFEEQHLWKNCIEIYQTLLRKTPDFDLYFLKLGEMYNALQEYETAISYYQKFITLRTTSEKFAQGEFLYWNMSDLKWFSADPDLVKAYFDLGVIHEYELNDHEAAFSIYLELLRHAPFYTGAYKHFWIVFQQIWDRLENEDQHPLLSITSFLQVYKLLLPDNYASVVLASDTSSLSSQTRMSEERLAGVPVGYYTMSDADHDVLIHQGEREYLRRVQNWLTNLVLAEDENQGIEEYCEQVGELNFPELLRIIDRISTFLSLTSPKCFISRGKIGISVRNKEKPYIFIGSEHLNKDHERYFSKDELLFIIATQAEHIKSGHLLITGTELWRSLGTASFDGFLVALQCLPAGSFLGRITHHFATAGLKKMYKMSRYSSLQKLLDFFHKGSEADRVSEESSDISEEAGSKGKKQTKPDSLIKEQIVDFARHAIYTADRVGLLACNNIGSACSVVFKLAGDAYNEIENIRKLGLFQVLGTQDKRGNFLYFEYTKRFAELIKFALSEEYFRLHSKLVILPAQEGETGTSPTRDTSEYHILINKLQLLEHSMQNELLTPEEFLRKQKNLVMSSGLLRDGDVELFEKLQQAFLDQILTLDEFHNKLFHLIEKKHEGRAEGIKGEDEG